jgi:hypothetical protein
MTEKQEFRVIRTYKEFELREYKPCVIAEVKVSEQYSIATNSAFSSLFKYISKGNRASQKIAMTAPVIAANRSEELTSDEWYISFVMPSGSTIGHLPFPNDPHVKLRELDTEICVAKSFKGKATSELTEQMTRQLRADAEKVHIALSDETRICRFDPPFKPGFMQRNEIVIPAYLWDF